MAESYSTRAPGHSIDPTEREALKVRAWRMHSARVKKEDIARELGVSYNTVTTLIKEAASDIKHDLGVELKRDIEILDEELEVAHTQYMRTRKHYDQMVVDRIVNTRAKLLGHNAPDRTENTHIVHTVDAADLEIMDIINESKAKNAQIKKSLRSSPPTMDEILNPDGVESNGE